MNYLWEATPVIIPLKFLGLWPHDDHHPKFKYTLSCIFAFIALVPTAIRIGFVGSYHETMDTISYILTFMITVYETGCFKWNRSRIEMTIMWMMKNWEDMKNYPPHLQSLMESSAKIGRRGMTVVNTIMFISFLDNMSYLWEITPVRIPLKFLGLWHDDPHSSFKYPFSCIFAFIVLVPTAARIGYVETYHEAMDSISYTLTALISVYEIACFKWNRSRVEVTMKWMEKNWADMKEYPGHLQSMMISSAKTGRRGMTVVYIIMFVSFLGFMGQPIAVGLWTGTTLRKFGNNGWYPFDVESSPNFEITIIIQYIATMYSALTLAGVDGYMLLTVFHCCGQVSILCDAIRNHVGQAKHDDETEGETIARPYCSCLHCIIHKHLELTRIIGIVDDTINTIIMLRIFLNAIQICTIGFIVRKVGFESPAAVFIHCMYFSSVTSSCFIYCWLGEQIANKNDEICDAVWNTNWHTENNRAFSHSLLMIMKRATHPMKITGGKYFTLSHEWFKEFFTTTISYLSVLLTVASNETPPE